MQLELRIFLDFEERILLIGFRWSRRRPGDGGHGPLGSPPASPGPDRPHAEEHKPALRVIEGGA